MVNRHHHQSAGVTIVNVISRVTTTGIIIVISMSTATAAPKRFVEETSKHVRSIALNRFKGQTKPVSLLVGVHVPAAPVPVGGSPRWTPRVRHVLVRPVLLIVLQPVEFVRLGAAVGVSVLPAPGVGVVVGAASTPRRPGPTPMAVLGATAPAGRRSPGRRLVARRRRAPAVALGGGHDDSRGGRHGGQLGRGRAGTCPARTGR